MQCRMCHNPLSGPPKTKGKMFCNIKCTDRFYRESRKNKTPIRNIPAKCINCGLEFLSARGTKRYCSRRCTIDYYSNNLKSVNESQHEIECWIKELAKKRYWANMVDIFQLIHYHSLIFPQKSYDNEYNIKREREEVFNFMLKDLVVWVKRKK
jgi:hypothetical protein